MEVKDWPMAGEMTSRIEFFENTTPVSDSGVLKRDTLSPLGSYPAKRIDGTGNVDTDGRLMDVSIARFQMRFVQSLFGKGGKLIIRDFDGDWNVDGPIQVMGGRNRYMQLKCVKRG